MLEFGARAIWYALYSGELMGYTFGSWEELDDRIDKWTSALSVSRSRVFEKWCSFWLELGDFSSAREQRAAFIRANGAYARMAPQHFCTKIQAAHQFERRTRRSVGMRNQGNQGRPQHRSPPEHDVTSRDDVSNEESPHERTEREHVAL